MRDGHTRSSAVMIVCLLCVMAMLSDVSREVSAVGVVRGGGGLQQRLQRDLQKSGSQ